MKEVDDTTAATSSMRTIELDEKRRHSSWREFPSALQLTPQKGTDWKILDIWPPVENTNCYRSKRKVKCAPIHG